MDSISLNITRIRKMVSGESLGDRLLGLVPKSANVP